MAIQDKDWNTNSDAHAAMLVNFLADRFNVDPDAQKENFRRIQKVAKVITETIYHVTNDHAAEGQQSDESHAMSLLHGIQRIDPAKFKVPTPHDEYSSEWLPSDSTRLATTAYLMACVANEHGLRLKEPVEAYTLVICAHKDAGYDQLKKELIKVDSVEREHNDDLHTPHNLNAFVIYEQALEKKRELDTARSKGPPSK